MKTIYKVKIIREPTWEMIERSVNTFLEEYAPVINEVVKIDFLKTGPGSMLQTAVVTYKVTIKN